MAKYKPADYETRYYRLREAYYRYMEEVMSILHDDDFDDDLREIDRLVGIKNFLTDNYDEDLISEENRYINLYNSENENN